MKCKLVLIICFLLVCFNSQAQKKPLTGKKLARAQTYYSLEIALKRPKKVIKLELESIHLQDSLSIIHTFQNLQEMTLRYSQLTTLPLGITQLSKLQKLELTKTQLKTLPWEITHLTNLQELSIPRNAFDTFPLAIAELANLHVLVLGVDSMKYFQNLENRLPKLERLSLGNNFYFSSEDHTDSLDWEQTLKSISNLTSLKFLYLNNITTIKKLPLEFQKLSNLELLLLDFLPNLDIGQAFTILAHLPNLQRIDLSWNQLKTLPVEVEQLKQVKVLHLDGYSLEDLPLSIANVPNLEIQVHSSKEIREKMEKIKERIPNLKIRYLGSW